MWLKLERSIAHSIGLLESLHFVANKKFSLSVATTRKRQRSVRASRLRSSPAPRVQPNAKTMTNAKWRIRRKILCKQTKKNRTIFTLRFCIVRCGSRRYTFARSSASPSTSCPPSPFRSVIRIGSFDIHLKSQWIYGIHRSPLNVHIK